ncbi:hypothetical protein KP509_12G076000 [Ceratopteris richardii]|nr:hypothetical protein KP509_12G076000 [Ceratopteris richardii]KAH7423829.1 hypothetical protein KP509_12G076000 [Ceratopteris richardii]KAH7423830.1 hypothetical protein KP509_12G076000 [Ceratopteris richardii]
MDAAYLRETLGQVVAKGCAETIAAAPVDPVHHLSLWLFKYVENVKIIAEFQKERDGLLQKQAAKTNKLKEEETIRQEKIQKQIDRIVELRLIQNDPYLLFDECLKAVLEFTGGTSAYVSLVLDKPWEPPKKAPDSEDGEEMPDNEAAEEEEEEDKEEDEKEKEEEVDEGDSGMSQENEGNDQENQGDDQQNEGEVMNDKIEGANNPDEVKKKKIKRRKPPNYKKKILLYVAATLDNQFIVNKRLDKKLGPVSFSVLLKGLPNLHVANVLYQEGMHFFQGLPLMGAYFTIPVMLNGDDPQVIALLCVDTLRKDHIGTGRPFSSDEQEFITAVAQAATDALSTSLSIGSANLSTKTIMKKLQEELEIIEKSHKSRAKGGQKIAASDEAQGEAKAEEQVGEPKDEDVMRGEIDGADGDGGEGKIDNVDTDVDEQDNTEDEAEVENEDNEKAEETEEEEAEEAEEEEVEGSEKEDSEQPDDINDSQKELRELEKSLKEQQKKVAKLQKHLQKCLNRLEKQATKSAKLQNRLNKSINLLSHLCTLLTATLDTIVKHKVEVFGQIQQCLFPSNIVHRILKALLHVLGHSDDVVHDWTKSRQALIEDVCNVMKDYSSLNEMDLNKWTLSDIYLDGITEAQLSEEVPVGYLAHQWLLIAKKVAFETMKCKDLKTRNESASKDFADVELEQMVADIDLRVAIDEEKKLALQVEDVQSKLANEISAGRSDDVQENAAEDEDVEE